LGIGFNAHTYKISFSSLAAPKLSKRPSTIIIDVFAISSSNPFEAYKGDQIMYILTGDGERPCQGDKEATGDWRRGQAV
jgi:hypothetical protein